MSKKSCSSLYRELLYNNRQYFYDKQYIVFPSNKLDMSWINRLLLFALAPSLGHQILGHPVCLYIFNRPIIFLETRSNGKLKFYFFFLSCSSDLGKAFDWWQLTYLRIYAETDVPTCMNLLNRHSTFMVPFRKIVA